MYNVYILKSDKNQNLYVGSCKSLNVRIDKHNRGHVKSTKAYRPWKLIYYEEHSTRSGAVQKEMFLKTGQQKERLKKKFKHI